MTPESYKAQAKRLSKHLKDKHGLSISHSAALEAVASSHGFRDWNTLCVIGDKDDSIPDDPWCVTLIGFDGMPHTNLIYGRSEAIWYFSTVVYAIQSLLPSFATICVGEDDDAVLTGLYLYCKQKDKDGSFEPYVILTQGSTAHRASMLPRESKQFIDMDFVQIAKFIDETLDSRGLDDVDNRFRELSHSFYALHLAADTSEQILDQGIENSLSIKSHTAASVMDTIWKAMQDTRFMVGTSARVVRFKDDE